MANYKEYFKEAFGKLRLVEKDFDISREALDGIEDWKNVETNADTLSSLEDVSDDGVETLEVIDKDAWVEDDLQDSYDGKVILECVACHSRITVDQADVYEDEETQTACPNIMCPVCHAELGYTILGKIEKFNAPDEEEEKIEFPDEAEEPVMDEPVVDEPTEEEEVEESLSDRIHRKHLGEAKEDVCPKCGKNPCVCESCKDEALEEKCEDCDESCKEELEEGKDCKDCEDLKECGDQLTEAVNNLSLDTDDTHLEMTADETGRISVISEPTTAPMEDIPDTAVEGEDSIVPLDMGDIDEVEDNISPDEQNEIMDAAEEEEVPAMEEEPVEGEEEEFEVEAESFNYLGNTFAKKLYENVQSYQMTSSQEVDGKMVVEGIINFNSGKSKNTTFTFDEAKETRTGRIVLEGINPTFFNSKAFKLKGKLNEGKLICESLKYNYSINRLNESTGAQEPVAVRGIVRSK